jgi:hypothetical protein
MTFVAFAIVPALVAGLLFLQTLRMRAPSRRV